MDARNAVDSIFKNIGMSREQFLASNFWSDAFGGQSPYYDILKGLTEGAGDDQWLDALSQLNQMNAQIHGPGTGTFATRGVAELLPKTGESLEDFYTRRTIANTLDAASRSPNISQDQYNRLVDYTKANNALPANLGEFFGPTPMVRPSTWYAGQRRQPRTYSLNKDTATGVPFKLEASGLPFYAYKPISNFGREVYDVFDQLEQSQLKAFNVDLSAY